MAEKQFALGGTRSAGFQEEDDPLAELARIVGFQEPSANRSERVEERREPVIAEFPVTAPQGAAPQAPGQNPVADLEDELLRAFETYDGPRAAAAEAAPAVEPVRSVSVASLNDEDDPFAALAAVVAQSEGLTRPASTPVAVAPRRVEPVVETAAVQAEAAPEPQIDFSVERLEAELLQSLDEAEIQWGGDPEPEPARAPSLPAATVDAPAITARTDFRMPLANFHAAAQPAAPVVTASSSASARQEPVAWDLPGTNSDEAVSAAPDLRPISGISAEQARPAELSAPAMPAAKVDPVFGASLAAISTVAEEVDPDLRYDQTFGGPSEGSGRADEPDFDELFTAGEFELDLDEFEQQLNDVTRAEQDRMPVTAPDSTYARAFADFVPESAVAQEPARQAPVVTAAMAHREPVFDFETETPRFDELHVEQARQAVVPPAPVAAAPAFAASPVIEPIDFDNGLFDPALLSESEDPVEVVEEIDVPELRIPEPEEHPAVVPDYDLDIDAEMANLFSSLPPLGVSASDRKPAVDASAPRAAAAAAPSSAATSSRAPYTVDSFDDFEKALEDDFRNMLSQPLGQPQEPRTRIEPQMVKVTPPRMNNVRSILLAACATGAVALVGFGGYFMVSGKAGVIASGEPKVILADKGPVKVVPENKGGVTVPNQDKAVYDRVAGNGDEPVKQTALITSEEEPVDVVQKTLMPENNDDIAMNAPAIPTPVEDTKDARLLPADKPANADADANAAVPDGVQVRKVRTMIVKADGTLVPREEEPATAAPSEPGLETTAAVPQGRVVPQADSTDASADALAAVANTDVATDPAAPTAGKADTAPVPTARPADQPVNVVGTVTENGNVKPGQQATAPQETASVDPAVAKPATAAPSGSYGIQIASLPSEADAQASIPKMAAKFGGVLGGRQIGIRQANIPNKGTYYRLRVDVGTKEEAVALCGKLKAAGGSCLVSK